MFFTCAPASPGAGRPKIRAPRRRRKTLTVDIHCHYISKRADEIAAPHFSIEKEPTLAFATDLTRKINQAQKAAVAAKMTDAQIRLAAMDAQGIDVQAISPAPTQYFYWLSPELGRATCRLINDELAGFAAAHPDRFVAMGTVPLQDVRLAVAEMERCVRDLDMRGIEISSHVNGEELASGRLDPFFARAEELDVLLFLHPLGFTEGRRLAKHYFNNVIGNPLESTIALGHLIFEGTLERYRGLKICIAHGGGYLPTYIGRMDHAHAARDDCRVCIARKPSDYLRQIYVDTVMFDPDQLRYVAQKLGPEHVLLGTDYPYDMAESDPIRFIDATAGLDARARADIKGMNAARLLKLDLAGARHPRASRP
jgi:aminocarboxymuconate-semialdehyde decarboxylase